ncbi:MAG: DUF4838 domain-containing protein [Clostridia bacterium]|nr:DUF4838 domain-containing protein [Clostridia bacterium]
MKRLKKAFSVALTGLFIGSAFASCNISNNTNTETGSKAEVWTGRGVHTASVEETNDYIVKNGRTEYSLLLPKDPKEYEVYAAELINEYMELSLGVTFPVVYATGKETADSGKYISIGDTPLMRSSAISVDQEKFGTAGFRLVTKGDDLYISGSRKGLRHGTYYGAQEFLRYAIDWEAYSYDEVQYNVLNDLKLANYDVVEIPEFDVRTIRTKKLELSAEYGRLLRLEASDEVQLPLGASHSHLKVLPYEKYGAAHPEWFVAVTDENGKKIGKALCFANEAMTDAFVAELVKRFEAYPDINFAHLGIMDTGEYCKCEACELWRTENNTNLAGQSVDFTNRVCRKTNELLQRTNPTRSVQLQLFAYNECTDPPVKPEDGKWVPDSPLVIPDDNVYVWYAPILANWSEAITSPRNQTFKDYLDGWSVLCDNGNLNVWQYNTNFDNILCMHKNFDTEATTLRAYSDAGVTRMYMQGHGNVYQAGMIELRNYVHSKLMWDPNLNYNELANEFIEHYYGPVAEHISEMYQKQTSYYEYLRSRSPSEGEILSGGLRVDLIDKKYWSFSYVDNIKNIMENAYESLKPLEKTDKTEYDKYYWRVGAAYMENLLLQMELYQLNYGKEYTYYVIDLMSSISRHHGYTTTVESTNSGEGLLTSYYTRWRATYA